MNDKIKNIIEEKSKAMMPGELLGAIVEFIKVLPNDAQKEVLQHYAKDYKND